MKRTICVILAAVICLCSILALNGCAKKDETVAKPAETASPPAAGGWTLNTDTDAAQIPEEAQKALDKALEGYTGASFTPVAYLGSQIVAGTNYALLCRTTLVTAAPTTKLSVVIVYQKLSGEAEILTVKDFNIADYNKNEDIGFDPAQIAGGWTVCTDYTAALPGKVQTAFDSAMTGLTGVSYNPVAYLGSQVVAGSNYAVLCTASTVTAQPSTALAVVIIYDAIDGSAKINSICGYELSISD